MTPLSAYTQPLVKAITTTLEGFLPFYHVALLG
jgi:hypothetical protein